MALIQQRGRSPVRRVGLALAGGTVTALVAMAVSPTTSWADSSHAVIGPSVAASASNGNGVAGSNANTGNAANNGNVADNGNNGVGNPHDTSSAGTGSTDGSGTGSTSTSTTSTVVALSLPATGSGATNTSTPVPAPTTSPQPLSNADQTSGGANNGGTCGAYCSTRDGSPSLNGNGTGTASGKPCAGCVGKADNKNPPGQYANGGDHNKGYECDGNNGIGKSNPAHTGCPTTPPSCVPTTANHHCNTDCVPTAANQHCNTDCVVTATNPCGSTTGCTTAGGCTQNPNCSTSGTCPPQTPSCTTNCVTTSVGCTPTAANGYCSQVLGETFSKPPATTVAKTTTTPATQVLGEKFTQGSLPFTGLDSKALLFAAIAFLLGGAAFWLIAAPRREPEA